MNFGDSQKCLFWELRERPNALRGPGHKAGAHAPSRSLRGPDRAIPTTIAHAGKAPFEFRSDDTLMLQNEYLRVRHAFPLSHAQYYRERSPYVNLEAHGSSIGADHFPNSYYLHLSASC